MALRFEIYRVEHPYELCVSCRNSLGWNCVTVEPGAKTARKFFVCDEHLGDSLKEFGETIILMIEQEKQEKGNEEV